MLLSAEHRKMVPSAFDDISFDLCKRRGDVILMSADLAHYCDMYQVTRDLPDQYVEVGMAEQNQVGVAAGLAKAGFVPITSTFGSYASRRCFDQMVICMGTSKKTGICLAFTPGITSPAPIHHQGTEDLGMLRAVPHATVIDPMDVTDFAQALDLACDLPGLVYMRGHRGATPSLLDPARFKFELGKTYPLREGRGIGVISCGHASQWALEASDILAEQGVDHSLLHVPTIKPVNEQEIVEYCFAHDEIVTVENHQVSTGLGGLVSEITSKIGRAPRITRIGVPDTWAPGGSLGHIRQHFGLDPAALAGRIAGVAA
ncbi:transketolase family protein [Pacificoceanicola onchidii]|uniref:transketolase family protein n=1 Tax=Pacificoceanicola onchidii TaxID=2562685 RepID=UPI0010A5E13A|nr:transketolase C-terminal domain-containing protein [Pacificoceanicola onchidii]